MSRVKINVSGTYFEFDRDILHVEPSRRLNKLCEHCPVGKPLELTVDRSAIAFGAILSYFQTGELHIPPGICPGAFRREMEFWDVDSGALYECCLYRYQEFIDDQTTRRRFLHKALPPTPAASPSINSSSVNNILSYRSKLWKIIDNNENSIAAKAYFVLVFGMVLLSILVLAFSTEPSMRRGVNKCELLEYLDNVNSKDYDKVNTALGNPECFRSSTGLASEGSWSEDEIDFSRYSWDYWEYSWGYSWEEMVDFYDEYLDENDNSNSTSTSPTTLSTSSTTSGNATTPPRGKKHEQPVHKTINLPDLSVPKFPFFVLDVIINTFFTIDLVLRLVSCPSLKRYLMSIINVLDAFALVACYVHLIIISIEKQYRYTESIWLNLLDFAQVFRALRLFRVVKNVRASKVLAYSLTQDLRDMTLLVMLLFVGISTFACLFYFAEPRSTIPSIPCAWYWAVVTMTTVGYGDISPVTAVGRVIASICAICGVLLLAITLPMFVNNFLTLYQYSCVNDSIKKMKEKKQEEETDKDKASKEDLVIHELETVTPPPAYESPVEVNDRPDTGKKENTICYVKEAVVT